MAYCAANSALIMASATPAPSERGKSTSALEERGVQALRRHAECPKVADAVIEAGLGQTERIEVYTLLQALPPVFSALLPVAMPSHTGGRHAYRPVATGCRSLGSA
jgi:hypothetical protein